MKVNALRFENFRNLKNGILLPGDGVNVIYGDNAQGKTNIIEAIWLFCGGHSFRNAKDNEVICWDNSSAKLEMSFFGQEREQKARLVFSKGRKSVEINGVEKKSAAALIERFCAVVFSPEHLNLIKRGPSERRRFIDSAICRERLNNAVIFSKYNRILTQRNSLLKDIYKRPSLEDTLGVWDEPLIKYGALLVRKRLDYISRLSDRSTQFHEGISGGKEKLCIKYISSAGIDENMSVGEIENCLREKYEKGRSDDIRAGITVTGPHRDDIEICINGKNSRSYASQGQQRSAVLSLKLAEASVLRELMGEEPVILLDDVLSELDPGRQDYLLNELEGCQVFITCCEPSEKDKLKNGSVFRIRNGEIL